MQLKSQTCNLTLECRYHSNSGGSLKSLNTVSPRWRPFKWDIRFVMLKMYAFFPPLCILAENALQIAMVLSSVTEKNFQTGEDMFTNDDVMSATQAGSHCNLKQQSLAVGNQTDWLIYQQSYFIGSRYRITFIYRSNKNVTHIGR